MKRIFLNICLFLIAFSAVERFCHKQTHGFSLHKIHSDLSFNPDWEFPPLSENEKTELFCALSQPYYFLNSGGEFYAFVSKDGKYVIKFFKHHHMRKKSWLDFFLPKSISHSRVKRLATLFSSCRLAFDRFQKQTGLIYLHLNKTEDLKITLKLFDRIGVMQHVYLDQLEFVLQKRASMAYPTITALAEARELEAAKVRLSSLVDLIISRCQVGLAEHDARKRNFGFIGENAIEIDIGSFSINEKLKDPEEMQKALLLETSRLRRWVKKYHPELSEFLDEKIEKSLIKIF